MKVKVVNSFPDIKVQWVQSFSTKPGQWQAVDAFPDYTVQFVQSFPDYTIQIVESFSRLPVNAAPVVISCQRVSTCGLVPLGVISQEARWVVGRRVRHF